MDARLFLPVTAVAASLLASGCVSLLPKPPPPSPLYALAHFQPEAAPGAANNEGAIIGLQAPEGPAAMLGDDLVWRRDQRVAFVEGAAWSGPARIQLVALLADALRRRPGVRAAALTNEGARPDVQLRWTVDAFEVQEDAGSAPVAHFVASAFLLDARNRALISTKRVGVAMPLAKRGSAEAARALRDAAQSGIDEIAGWAGSESQAFTQKTASKAAAPG